MTYIIAFCMFCCWHIQSSNHISITCRLQVQASDSKGPWGRIKRHEKTHPSFTLNLKVSSALFTIFTIILHSWPELDNYFQQHYLSKSLSKSIFQDDKSCGNTSTPSLSRKKNFIYKISDGISHKKIYLETVGSALILIVLGVFAVLATCCCSIYNDKKADGEKINRLFYNITIKIYSLRMD